MAKKVSKRRKSPARNGKPAPVKKRLGRPPADEPYESRNLYLASSVLRALEDRATELGSNMSKTANSLLAEQLRVPI